MNVGPTVRWNAERASVSEVMRRLVRRSAVRAAITLAFDWGIIAAAVFVGEYFRSGWSYASAVIVIARQMNALYELHHQAIHGNLFRVPAWNERLDWLYSVPLLTRVAEDREDHMEHHRSYGVESRDYRTWGTGYGLDPSCRDEGRYMLWFLLVRPFTGAIQLDALRGIVRSQGWKHSRFRRPVSIFWGGVAALLFLAGRLDWVFWYWLVPYSTAYPILFFWDDMIGHYNCPRTGTREMRGLWFRVMAAHGTSYHNVHHLCPSIPWFNQKRATALLVDERSVDVARGFADAIRQMAIACD